MGLVRAAAAMESRWARDTKSGSRFSRAAVEIGGIKDNGKKNCRVDEKYF